MLKIIVPAWKRNQIPITLSLSSTSNWIGSVSPHVLIDMFQSVYSSLDVVWPMLLIQTFNISVP